MASKNNGLRQRRARNTGNRKNNRENSNTIAEQYATNHDLFGPISAELLIDPVRIRGETAPGAFEREQITRWLNERGTSPTTRNQATVADLEPAQDIQQEIRELVRRYPNAQIVQDWLQHQPPWYTRAIQQISNIVTPPLQVMSRAVEPIRQVMPSAETCAKCCVGTVETGAGAVVGAGVGGCAGCICAAATATANVNDPETATTIAATTIPVGAVVGAAVGSCLGPRDCIRCAGEACKHAMENNNNHWGGKRRRKTRKGKRKKRRKTRKRKIKQRKTHRRKYKKRRKTRKR